MLELFSSILPVQAHTCVHRIQLTDPMPVGTEVAAVQINVVCITVLQHVSIPNLLSADEEKLLAEQVQQACKIREVKEDLTKQLKRPPTDTEWAEACDQSSE